MVLNTWFWSDEDFTYVPGFLFISLVFPNDVVHGVFVSLGG